MDKIQHITTGREYYNYSGEKPFEAQILEIRPYYEKTGNNPETENIYAVLLDKTIFYPEGGGQPGDRGFINGFQVNDVIEKNNEILHLLTVSKEKPAPGTGKAELVLDARRRRDFSACHTGQHLLSGVLFHEHGIPTMSVHLGDEVCFIDINCPEIAEEKIIGIENRVNDIIVENRPVILHLCPPDDAESFPLRKPPPKGEEVLRIIEIKGADFSACCGTHLSSTGEIGMFRILGAEKYKGMIRLAFIAGRRCLTESRLLRKNAEIISHALSIPVNETGSGVLDFIKKNAELEQQIKIFKEESCRIKAGALIKKQGEDFPAAGISFKVITEKYEAGINDIINIGKAAQKLSPAIFLLISETENKFAAFCSNDEIDLRVLFQDKLK